MSTTKLHNVGGSVMLAVPPALFDILRLGAGIEVGLVIDKGRLVVEPRTKRRDTMAELLAGSDFSQAQCVEQREWVDAPAVGPRAMNRDEIWMVDLDPTERREQRGHRPVLIVSPKAFNPATGLPVILPTTNGDLGRRTGFAVALASLRTTGIVRCDQPRVP